MCINFNRLAPSFMKVKLFFIVFLVGFLSNTLSAQLLQWNTFGNAGTETTEPSVFNNTNISAANLTLGAGVTAVTNANRFGGNTWFDTGDSNPTTLAQSISGNDYIEFIVSPTSGFSFTPTGFVFSWDQSGTGPNSVALRSSADGFTTNLGTVTGLPASISTGNSIAISTLTNITAPTIFRLYGYGGTGTAGTGGFDTASSANNVVLNGTTTSAGITTAQAGDWYTGTTWTGGVVPTNAQNAIVKHFVTANANITRDAGTVTNIDATVGKLTMTGATYNNNGTTNVNGTFQLNNGAWATSSPLMNYFVYGAAGTLNFNTTGNYSVYDTDVFWPSANSPFNVNVLNGGLNMINASRTVAGQFSTANIAPAPPVLGIQLTTTVLRLNGTARINAGGFFTNPPVYGPASTLVYAPGGPFAYGRGTEWNAAGVGTIGTTPGYPNNVQITNNTVLNYPNGGTPGIKAIEGNLQVDGGSSLYMDYGGISTAGPLVVKKDFVIGGNMTLGFASGDDIKIGGNITFNSGYNFNPNNRSVFLTKAGTQVLTAVSATPTFHYLNFDLASGTTLQLAANTNLNITAPLGNNIITWQSGNTIDLNNRTLTLGTVGLPSVFNGTANFSGSSSGTITSTLILQGNDDIGTLRFNSGSQNLHTLTINRPSATVGCSLGSPLVITSALNMTSGKFDVGNNPLTLGAAVASVTGATATNYIIADGEAGTSAAVRKVFTGAGSFTFPIGDRAASTDGSQYAPVSVVLPSASYSTGAYVSAVVFDIVQPNLGASTDYLTRYWNIGTNGITGFTQFSATANYLATPVGTDIVGTEANYLVNRFDGTDWSTNGTGVNAVAKTFVADIFPGATNNITAGLREQAIVVKGVIASNPTIPNGDTTPQGTDNTLYATTTIAITKSFRIVNTGNKDLVVTAINQSGPGDFTVDAVLPYSIPGGTFVDFDIIFSPIAAGVRTAIISIINNDSTKNPYTFTVQGTGSGAEIEVYGNGTLIVTPDTTPSLVDHTDFGLVDAVLGSVTRVFSISNIGDISLSIASVTITGANASDFTITSSPVGNLAGGTGTILSILFDPSAVGVRKATVTINNDDTNEGTFTFDIQGNGIDYVACALGAVELIGQNNFEVTPPTPFMAYTFIQDSGAGVAGPNGGNAYGSSRTSQVSKAIGARSFQVAGHSGSTVTQKKKTTITFDMVDASAFQEVSLTFNLGAYTTVMGTTPNPGGLDTNDERITVYISKNNGITWSEEFYVNGFSNSIWAINAPTSQVVYFDGNNIAESYGPNTPNTINVGPSKITLNGLPSSTQLRVRIVLALDRTDELWAIDDVKLQGRKPAIATYTDSPPTWTPAPPTASVRAIINGAYDTAVSGNINACECLINTGRTVNINTGRYVNIESDIENKGIVTVKSGGNLVQRNDIANNTGAGSYSVERKTPNFNRFDYTYWTAPVFGPLVTIPSVFSGWRTDYAFTYETVNHEDLLPPFGFDDNQDVWQGANLLLPMEPGKGYAIMGRTTGAFPASETVVFDGTVYNGNIPVEVKKAANGYGQNLIGNPYPSSIFADEFIYLNAITNPTISGTLYFWTHKTAIAFGGVGPDTYNFTANDYAMYNLTGPIGTGSGDPSVSGSAAPTGYIASGQGFFVDAKIAGDVIFNNKMRDKNYNNTNFFRMAVPTAGEPGRDRVWLNMTSVEGLFSQQLVGYFENTTNGYDAAYDGLHNPSSTGISFYSLIGGDKYRIQGRAPFENTDHVKLGFSSAIAKTFSIEIDRTEGQFAGSQGIYLEDSLMNTTHNLKEGPYTFATEVGTFEDRFTLKYTDETLGGDENIFANNVLIVSDKSQINIKSSSDFLEKVTVYDLLGRALYNQMQLQTENLTINTLDVGVQPLIVRVVLSNGQEVTKKIIFGTD